MTLVRASWLVGIAMVLCPVPRTEAAVAGPGAEQSFAAGDLAAARAGFSAWLAAHPRDTLSLNRLTLLALLRNRLDEARVLEDRAREAGVAPRPLDALVAESYYREDRFAEAAPLFRRAGRTALADKLEAFGSDRPYRMDSSVTIVVPFVQTDPLPVVEMKLNGAGPFYFIIDTGGGELIVDPTFADSVSAERFGDESGVFAGDRRRRFAHGRLGSIELGGVRIEDVPVQLLDTRGFSAAAGGRRVAGVIGTVLLYHFRSTLDYPGGRLMLEPRGGPPRNAAFEVPMWLASDHLILARGTVNASDTLVQLVDTGLAGAAFTCPRATLADAGIALDDTTGVQGVGGGGAVRIVPFQVKRLSLGGAVRVDQLGFLGAFPESLAGRFPFRIAGLVSHAFFRPWRLTLDFDSMRIGLDPPGD
jgi:Aspartyl protease